jgi:hypothetical protein
VTGEATLYRAALISADGVYRYSLTRCWGRPAANVVRWVMLNPSSADEQTDDNTIRRCVRFSRAWGYSGLVVHNLYALRATDPDQLLTHPAPVGPDNDVTLAGWRAHTVCAWGAHRGTHHGRVDHVLSVLRQSGSRVMCLGLTKTGHPRHLLYLRASTQLEDLPQ